MKSNSNGRVKSGIDNQKTMCDTLSTATSSFPFIYGSSPKFELSIEKSITEPDNGHKTESISAKLSVDYKLESERLKTFENWRSDVVQAGDLAKSGFYSLTNPQQPDLVKCAFCKVEICNWETGDDALGEHIKWSPNCSHAIERCMSHPSGLNFLRLARGEDVCGNAEIFSSVSESETFRRLTEMNKSYEDENLRLETFAKWPKNTNQNPKDLAEAGFYYRGVEDHTICFSCGGALKDWIAEDNPWEQHAMWFPRCKYLLTKKGEEYVEEIQRKMKPQVPKPTKEEEKKSEDSERSPSQEVLLCKICDSNERNVIFRPCNHILACDKCSVLLQKCPVCRNPIEERMKVYLS